MTAFLKTLEEYHFCAAYFSTPDCGVCKSIKPGIIAMFEKYPRFHLFQVDTEKSPQVAAQNLVFSIPTLVLFSGGRESKRFSRYIRKEEVELFVRQMTGL